MQTYPLKTMNINEALKKQFALVDAQTRYFTGAELLSLGDLGVAPPDNKPTATAKAEKVLADFFNVEALTLVRGAGTAAIRWGLWSFFAGSENKKILVHKAPIYPTTSISIDSLSLQVIEADFNSLEDVQACLKEEQPAAVLVQYTRQQPHDSYDMGSVINLIKSAAPLVKIITDDNYAALKVAEIGAELGADLSAFSGFKLLGPEGVGILAGKQKFVSMVAKVNYSGGGQVQGHEAMELLRSMVYAPVMLAIQADVGTEVVKRLNSGEVTGVGRAYIANAQSRVIIVEFKDNIAKRLLAETEKLGAAPWPVGAESKYEVVPMFYRVSGTFLAYDSSLAERAVRINPMRAGADTVIRILREGMKNIN